VDARDFIQIYIYIYIYIYKRRHTFKAVNARSSSERCVCARARARGTKVDRNGCGARYRANVAAVSRAFRFINRGREIAGDRAPSRHIIVAFRTRCGVSFYQLSRRGLLFTSRCECVLFWPISRISQRGGNSSLLRLDSKSTPINADSTDNKFLHF
jgi:hypothetical protein